MKTTTTSFFLQLRTRRDFTSLLIKKPKPTATPSGVSNDSRLHVLGCCFPILIIIISSSRSNSSTSSRRSNSNSNSSNSSSIITFITVQQQQQARSPNLELRFAAAKLCNNNHRHNNHFVLSHLPLLRFRHQTNKSRIRFFVFFVNPGIDSSSSSLIRYSIFQYSSALSSIRCSILV